MEKMKPFELVIEFNKIFRFNGMLYKKSVFFYIPATLKNFKLQYLKLKLLKFKKMTCVYGMKDM